MGRVRVCRLSRVRVMGRVRVGIRIRVRRRNSGEGETRHLRPLLHPND
jgi:hypothetical protein